MLDWNLEFCLILVTCFAHFLWQGLFIGIVFQLLMRLLRKSSPQLRHSCGLVCLLLFALCVPVTYTFVNDSFLAEPVVVASNEGIDFGEEAIQPLNFTTQPISAGVIPEPIVNEENASVELQKNGKEIQEGWSFRHAAPFLLGIYFVGVMFFICRLGFGVYISRIYRRVARPVTEPEFLKIIDKVTQQVGLAVQPSVMWCKQVAVPSVVGIIKPTVLLPLACLTQLQPEQLEQILIHEITHIRRYDHIINLAQNTLEAILFFHPVVWFVSRQVRLEREFCCDAAVLATGKQPDEYAKSLIDVARISQSLQTTSIPLSVPSVDRPSKLRLRIDKMMGQHQRQKNHLFETGSLITVATVLGLCCLLAIQIPSAAELVTGETNGVLAEGKQAKTDKGKVILGKWKSELASTPWGKGHFLLNLMPDNQLTFKILDKKINGVIKGHWSNKNDGNYEFAFEANHPDAAGVGQFNLENNGLVMTITTSFGQSTMEIRFEREFNELFDCVIIDSVNNEPIPDKKITIRFFFKKPAANESTEEVVGNLIWGNKSPSQFKFKVPDKVMMHPDRDKLVVEWAISHPDYETLLSEKPVSLIEILSDNPKSAREIFRRIKLKPRQENIKSKYTRVVSKPLKPKKVKSNETVLSETEKKLIGTWGKSSFLVYTTLTFNADKTYRFEEPNMKSKPRTGKWHVKNLTELVYEPDSSGTNGKDDQYPNSRIVSVNEKELKLASISPNSKKVFTYQFITKPKLLKGKGAKSTAIALSETEKKLIGTWGKSSFLIYTTLTFNADKTYRFEEPNMKSKPRTGKWHVKNLTELVYEPDSSGTNGKDDQYPNSRIVSVNEKELKLASISPNSKKVFTYQLISKPKKLKEKR